MTAALVTAGVFLFALLAEWLHLRRVRKIAPLAFGGAPGLGWARTAAFVRVVAISLIAWGCIILFYTAPKSNRPAKQAPQGGWRHLVLLLDVSPSMRLEDAGAAGNQRRILRARDVVDSVFSRIALDQTRISVVAFYSEARRIVNETADLNVIRNILDDLPLRWAFPSGKTNLFAGLRESAALARDWNPGSTTVFIVSDGDTVPDAGMPPMPKSVAQVIVVGVGNASAGKFIDGHMSKQDAPALRQVAGRLGGTYFDANAANLPSATIRNLAAALPLKDTAGFGLREAALCAVVAGSALLALLPVVLAAFVRQSAKSPCRPAAAAAVPN